MTYRMYALATALVLGLAAAQAAPADSVTFKFNPANGLTVIQTDKDTDVQSSSTGDKRTRVEVSKMKVAFKKNAKGYTMALSLLSNTMTENGKAAKNANLDFLKGITMTYALDPAGRFITLTGLDPLRKKMELDMTGREVQEGKSKKIIQALIKQRKNDWQQEFERFIGKTVKIGDVWRETKDVPFPLGGTLPVEKTLTFAGHVKVGARNCVRLRYAAETNDAKVKVLIDKAMARIREEAKKEKKKDIPSLLSMKVKQARERVVDPATMMVYSESLTETRTTAMDIPGKGKVTMNIARTKMTTYEYK